MRDAFPASQELQAAFLRALLTLGEGADNSAIEGRMATELGLSDELLNRPHDSERGGRTEFSYRLAWLRTKLKSQGLIERAGYRRWRLTPNGVERAEAALREMETP